MPMTSAASHRRWSVFLAMFTAVTLAVLLVVETNSPAAIGADTTTSSTIPAPVIALGSFPVQGKCSFTDTYGAPRSGGRLHEGVDLIAKSGQFVYAVANGTLTKQYVDAPGSLSGNGWRLTMANGTYFFYAHFSGFPPGLTVGSKVVAGQIIGYVGETGNAGTPHLHFEIHPGGGAPINPTQSVKAVDGCAITTPPAVASNPSIPATPPDSGSFTGPTLAKAVRIPSTDPTVAPDPGAPTTTVAPAPPTSVVSLPTIKGSGRWTFVEPVVLFNGTGATALVANTPKQIAVTGVAGVSQTAAALMLRVSATAGSAGTVTVHPCAIATPAAVSLTVEAGPMAIGTAIVAVSGGSLCVTSTVAASVKLTVMAQTTTAGVGLRPIATRRALDSRTTGRLAANAKVTLAPSALGIASTSKAVTATFTIIGPSAAGTLSISACGGTELKAPFTSAALSAFSVVVPVNSTGLCLSSTVAVDVIVDVDGTWEADASSIVPAAPVRVLGSPTTGVTVGPTPTNVTITGVGGLPATVTVANLQITMIAGAKASSAFVWPCDQPRPDAAIGVVAPNRRTTFVVAAAVSAGQICVATNEPASVFVDVSGIDP